MLSPLSYLLHAAGSFPDRKCLYVSGKEFTYAGFYDSLAEARSFFAAHGVAAGKKVAIYSDDDLLMLRSVFALWEMGATAIPMNIKYTPDKLRKIEENIQPDLGFYSPGLRIGDAGALSVKELSLTENVAAVPHGNGPANESDVALIMFTSGSTGLPKGVPISHAAVYTNSRLTAERLGVTAGDRIFINTPTYTTSSLLHVLTMFSKGASIVIEKGFMFGSGLLSQIVEHDCTGFGGVPVHFSRILSGLEKAKSTGRLRFLMNSGEHLPVPVIKKVREKLPQVQIYCVYGLTEVAGRLCILDDQYLDEKYGSVGKPLEGMDVSIRDENGEISEAGTEGQVYVSGPLLTAGYINNEAVNKKEFTKWGFATGDYGYKDKDGFLFLKGRRDDIIKVGGEKVSVKMIEEVLYDYDDFKEFIVQPVYDANMGCVPALQYVLKEGRSFDRPSLIRFLSAKLPSTHIPVKFEEIEAVERTSSGKSVRKKV